MLRHDLSSLRPARSASSAGPAFCPLIRCRPVPRAGTEFGGVLRGRAGRLPVLAGPAIMKRRRPAAGGKQDTARHRRVITARTPTLRPRARPGCPYGYTAKYVWGRQHEPQAAGPAAEAAEAADDGVPHACGPADPRT